MIAAQIAQKRARGRELASRSRARLTLLVDRGEKAANRRPIEACRFELGRRDARLDGDVLQELREIAFVRAHGVRRRVAIQLEELEKGTANA